MRFSVGFTANACCSRPVRLACNDSAIRFAISLSTLKDVSQLPIVGLCPEMGIILRVDQLNSYPHLIGRFLHAAFKNVRYA